MPAVREAGGVVNPWAMLGLLIVCLIVVCLYVKFWADIISPGPTRSDHGMRDGQDWHHDG